MVCVCVCVCVFNLCTLFCSLSSGIEPKDNVPHFAGSSPCRTPTTSTSLQEMAFTFPPDATAPPAVVPTGAQRTRRRASMQDALDHTKINTSLYDKVSTKGLLCCCGIFCWNPTPLCRHISCTLHPHISIPWCLDAFSSSQHHHAFKPRTLTLSCPCAKIHSPSSRFCILVPSRLPSLTLSHPNPCMPP